MIDGIRQAVVSLDQRVLALEGRMDQRFAAVDRRFTELDAKISRQFQCVIGVQMTTFVAIVATILAAFFARP